MSDTAPHQPDAEAALREVLSGRPSLELRRRTALILEKLEKRRVDGATHRALLTIDLLEQQLWIRANRTEHPAEGMPAPSPVLLTTDH